MDAIFERAREIGRLVSQSDEYKALKRANDLVTGDRDAVTLLNRLSGLENELTSMLRAGQEPSEEQQREYESLLEQIQQMSAYQAMAAAQTNFDRLMMRINEEIAKGIEAGEQSRIILP